MRLPFSFVGPWAALFMFACSCATGQMLPEGASPEPTALASGQPEIADISLRFEGPRNVSDPAVFAHIRVREGDEYNQDLIDQSIRSLYETGLYEFIEVQREPAGQGRINLLFVVVPKFKIESITYEGNEAYSDSTLSDKIESEVGMPVDEVQIKRDADALFEYYQKRGYSLAEVDYQILRNEKSGLADVTFLVSEGEKLRITDITFEGNEAYDDGDLRDEMSTAEYNVLWSWITGSGRFEEGKFQDDLEKLRQFYKNHGYLDVEIPEDQVQFNYPDEDELEIVITVEEGRQYHLGQVRISGNTLYSEEEIMSAVTLEPGEVFSPEKVDKNVENVQDYYGQYGYLDTFVRAERIPNLETGNIDLTFMVQESDKYFVESINISGNTKTKSVVIVRELALAPGDVFDTVRMKSSEARLRNTRFFDDVSLIPEATNIPGRRNLRITVTEARTGNITFGAGFSSVEQAVAFAELSQSNFDLFNYRSLFQGDGQKFRMRFSIGTRSNQILISFEEPWVYERRLAFGFELFRTETDYLSTLYNELRTGFEVYFRRRLFELVEGRVFYRLEDVKIFDVDANASQPVQSEAGSRSVSTGGISLTRDTRDSLLIPTTGSRVQLITSLSGGPFMGDTDYWRNEVRAGKWFEIHPYHTQVLQLVGRTGTLIPYNDQSVPFFDRYFLGGPYSLRGFGYRDVGPRNTLGQEVGGDTFAYGSVEYSIEIVDPVRFATFYDWGFVNASDMDWDPSDYNDNWGVGLRVLIMGAPLRLDLGFPITTGRFNDDGMQFNFSFGTVF